MITKSSVRRAWRIVAKCKVFVAGGEGPRGSCGKKALNCQTPIVGYLQFVDRKQLQAAQCSTGYSASTAPRKVHKRLSVSGIAVSTTERWFCEAMLLAPREVAALYNLGGEFV
jgi:hypothetical protein